MQLIFLLHSLAVSLFPSHSHLMEHERETQRANAVLWSMRGAHWGTHIRGEDRQRDRRVDMFWQNSKTPPYPAAFYPSISLSACLWTQAFINNLFINMLGNPGGRWSEEGRQEGGERKMARKNKRWMQVMELRSDQHFSSGVKMQAFHSL